MAAPELIASSEALVVFDSDSRVVQANRAAEELLGERAVDLLGQPCWTVLAGRDDRGQPLCTPGCAHARAAQEGWPVPCVRMVVQTTHGRRCLSVSTVVVRGNGSGPYVWRLLREDRQAVVDATCTASLSARQREVLDLVASGEPARRIARRLGIAETTVRNHIRAILVELGAHSQLEAVARARQLGLV